MSGPLAIDKEHNWFWKQGYSDAFAGLLPFLLDELRWPSQRSDYFAGYEAGNEDRLEMMRGLERKGTPI